jgi:hypothetical protein
MRSRRLFLAALAPFAACTLLSMTARAQITTAATLLVTNPSRTVPLRTDPLTQLWISHSDCVANDTLNFPVIINGAAAGLTLEVWASSGASCLPPESRTTAAAECWRVFSGPPSPQTLTVPIRVQDIAAQQKPPTFSSSVGTVASCSPADMTTAAQPVTLFFMLLSGTENQGGSSWATKIDLVPPTAPIENPLGIGNTLLVVDWASNTDPDVAGYNFFCDPPLGTTASPVQTFGAGSGDAGTTGAGGSNAVVDSGSSCTEASAATPADDAGADATDNDASDAQICTTSTGTGSSAGADAAALTGSNCGSTHLFAGITPDAAFAATFSCGSVAGFQATSFNIIGLVNNVPTTVATSATDAVGNIGALSNVQCQTPQVVFGFPQAYQGAGGTAGGGFCAMGRFPSHSRWGIWAALLGLGTWLGRRGRRSASS